MPYDVIMPALGMAQDRGLIVSWLKSPGDRVAKGEPLFEVETDKATMEVEAQAEGFISAVAFGAGADVPVGEVTAQIVETEGEVDKTPPKSVVTSSVPAKAGVPPTAPPIPAPVVEPVAAARPAPVPPRPSRPSAPSAPAGRILASPKARRLSAERGLDLARLVSAGVQQPYHVADLDRLAELGAGQRSVLTAQADAGALDTLLAKSGQTDHARLFASFAKGAWRAVFDAQNLPITVQHIDGTIEAAAEPDQPALLLTDLTATRLTGYVAEGSGLSLSVAREGGAIALTFAFSDAELAFADAAAWLDELAMRIEDPVRQLV